MKNYIMIDYTPSDQWIFKKDLEERLNEEFDLIIDNSNKLMGGLNSIRRYIHYFLTPLKVVIRDKSEGIIVSWQQFYGLNYAFWKRLFHQKKNKKNIVMTFIYNPRGGGIGKIYYRYMKYIVCSKYIDAFICFSRSECQYYAELFGVSKDKFVSCKLTLPDDYEKYRMEIRDEGFYLAAGRSNRDYSFLCESFKMMPERRLIIVSDSFEEDDVPQNVTIKNNIYGDDYMKLLSACRAVIVSLKEESSVSAGQLVMLQSMMMGKICIVTDTIQTREYIENKENGILISNNVDSLMTELTRIDNNEYEALGQTARDYFIKHFSNDSMSEAVASVAKKLMTEG